VSNYKRKGRALMDDVRFGSTGLTISRLCLGCMTYGASGWREWVLAEREKPAFYPRGPRERHQLLHP
jgi:aryl-alcohol dehydrogenase-like predicted oxidoreductase